MLPHVLHILNRTQMHTASIIISIPDGGVLSLEMMMDINLLPRDYTALHFIVIFIHYYVHKTPVDPHYDPL
jgi:hypothetical protein